MLEQKAKQLTGKAATALLAGKVVEGEAGAPATLTTPGVERVVATATAVCDVKEGDSVAPVAPKAPQVAGAEVATVASVGEVVTSDSVAPAPLTLSTSS